jgi:hypothetical protein
MGPASCWAVERLGPLNAGWANLAEITTAATQAGAFALTAGSRDAALLCRLRPISFLSEKGGSSQVGLAVVC